MSIKSTKGSFGIASFLILCLIGSLYYAYDKSTAYQELQQNYNVEKNQYFTGVVNPTNTITEEEIGIAKGLIQGSFDDLWGGMDSTKILDYHTDDYYILEHGEVWDNARVAQFMKERLKQGEQPRRVNRMEYHTVEKFDKVINIAYINYGDFYRGDSLVWEGRWLESAFIIPSDKGWRIRSMHSTRMPVDKNE